MKSASVVPVTTAMENFVHHNIQHLLFWHLYIILLLIQYWEKTNISFHMNLYNFSLF